MKNIISCVMGVALAALLLCGCGMDRMDNETLVVETPYVSPSMAPSASPMVTPDIEDGIVDDRDGIIEEERDKRSGTKQDSTTSSPQVGESTSTPRATSKP